jgi:quinolinate synthase
MKLNTLEKLRDCLRDLSPQILIPEDIRARAEVPIRRMLELSKN